MAQSIASQVDEFNVGFNDAVGPELAAVFAAEQEDLNTAGVPDDAITVGDRIPDAALLTVDGGHTSLDDVLGSGAAVLVFYRGAWCPYCNLALKHYQQELVPALESRGVALVAISPQTPEGSAAAVANGDLGFGVYSDPAARLIRQLGIITEPSADARKAHTALGFDVADSNADDTAGIPFPSVVVVDADRVARFVDIHVDYTSRTEVDVIVGAVDALPRD